MTSGGARRTLFVCDGSGCRNAEIGCSPVLADFFERQASEHGFQIWWSDCLDFCEEANVVRGKLGEDGVFFGGIDTKKEGSAVVSFLESGQIPEDLKGRRLGS